MGPRRQLIAYCVFHFPVSTRNGFSSAAFLHLTAIKASQIVLFSAKANVTDYVTCRRWRIFIGSWMICCVNCGGTNFVTHICVSQTCKHCIQTSRGKFPFCLLFWWLNDHVIFFLYQIAQNNVVLIEWKRSMEEWENISGIPPNWQLSIIK